MHKTVVPRKSGVHRFACLALYRALLRQCAKLPNTAPELSSCKPLIQQKFQRYKKLQSPSQAVNALKAGYEALDLLHSASQGNQRNTNRIVELMSEIQSIKQRESALQRELSKKEPKPLSRKQQKTNESRRLQDQTARRHPDATSILSRPRPVVSGKRRVPVLVNARGVPFLRIKKPQPKNLSGVIRLDRELLFANDEDNWDALTTGSEPDTWAEGVKDALGTLNQQIHDSDKKNIELAEAMWNIVLAERKLAAEEEKQKSTEKPSDT
ncbi:hypothetical protein ANOM_002188 [Aspergillus nomiae NRRL 13137]|uniref:Complex 1 LYR protein domain-containing protein n=1 Tax=Aspergillus nomiae NRRL (strain ATCC 15546 / NRRL 13137 / CBS 260.88 / M93) TaxID=1509407 RepID=A0A0L1JB52_ASPN3|nr:uncharacterized protein ANOM_002188 [Aspergillus nomiae NRRL 13137]KNG88979.1 hypothetical protein ANOM_002188 [Aspergillus nomiae NRRL 13137]